MKTSEPQNKKAKPPTPKEWRGDLRRAWRDMSLTDTFTALCERYPNPGPKTMAKLEALYVQITGTSPPA